MALPQEYRLRLLDITLGSGWGGGNEGLAHFADVGSVYELILDSPEIDDAGLAQLGSAELEGLTARTTTITDEGLGHLKKVRGLRMVRLDGSRVTDAGVEAESEPTISSGLSSRTTARSPTPDWPTWPGLLG